MWARICSTSTVSQAEEYVPALAGCSGVRFPAKAGRVGLRNLGNTCFMNAGLQCLSHIEPLVAYFLSGQYEEDVNATSTFGCKGELARSFAELQRTLWQSDGGAHDPSSLHATLTHFAPHLFKGYDQQDVQEFLTFCLDGLNEDLNRVLTQPVPTSEELQLEDERLAEQHGDEFGAALSWLRYLERGTSFLVDLLQGQLQSSLTCMRCGHRSRRFDPFLYLSLPVTWKMSRITHAITKYLEEEVLTGDERWFCTRCKCKVDARKKIDLWKLPPVLVLHLKRFEFDSRSGNFRKIDRALRTPEMLDLLEFCSSPQRQGAKYKAVAVANHVGPYGSGHYTATCRAGLDGSWHQFNDDSVTPVRRQASAVGPEAYVIFLVRCREEKDAFRQATVKPQTVTMPELWPHWLSTRNSGFEALLQQAKEARAKEAALTSTAGSVEPALVLRASESIPEVEDKKDPGSIRQPPQCTCFALRFGRTTSRLPEPVEVR